MKLFNRYSLLVAVALFLASCDCGQIVKGVVLIKHNKQPIEGVEIEKIYRTSQSSYSRLKGLSDSSGHFDVHYVDGGVFTCPDFKLSFAKQGFISQKIVYNGINLRDTVYLEKVK